MSLMNTSVSGMMADTNWLSTISQNVANANTTGYKTAQTDFMTVVDVSSSSSDYAAGVTTSLRSLNALQGSITSTATPTNIAVQGQGFFVVSDASGAIFLTRNGSFVPDANGDLVNSAGYYLMADDIQPGVAAGPTDTLAGLGRVNVNSMGMSATPTTAGVLTVNLPADATPVAAGSLPSTNAAGATYTDETSLVAYDNLGRAHNINIYLTNTGSNAWEATAFDAADAAPGGGFPYSSGPLATGTLAFDPTTGGLTSGSPLTFTVAGGQTVNLDLSKSTQFAAPFSVSTETANGNGPISMQSVSIGADGTMTFNATNGSSIPAYKIPLANVESPDNLIQLTGNVYTASAASGPIFVGAPNSGGFGTIAASSLESSTVNLDEELTNMIEAQAAYQANSKVFQTGANILDILNGLKP